MKNKILFLLAFALTLGFWSCDDDEKSGVPKFPVHDPNKDCKFEGYIPAEGGAGSKLIIKGTNFGTDTALVKVTVNEKNARIIGVNGERIYAVVPTRADVGKVKVWIGAIPEGYKVWADNGSDEWEDGKLIAMDGSGDIIDDPRQIQEFETDFEYHFRQNVTTLAGTTTEDGKGGQLDGTLEDSMFSALTWLTMDNDGVLYLAEQRFGLRILNIAKNEVSRPYATGNRLRAVEFTRTQDTLLIAVDEAPAGVQAYMATRAQGFMDVKPYMSGQSGRWLNFICRNPVDDTIIYNHYGDGTTYRYDPDTKSSTAMFKIDGNHEVHGTFSPDGEIFYLVSRNKHSVYSFSWNFDEKIMEKQTLLAGQLGQEGFADGIGPDVTRFRSPSQPTVDEYNILYVADKRNHCIRKITPTGIVSTFAGIPGEKGYMDGEPLNAQFNEPEACYYDYNESAFYIGDYNNFRIRKIVVE